MREHHHEQPELALAAGERQLADERPVHLRLLAGQGLGRQVDLAARPWAHQGDVLAQRSHRAGEAALAHHVVEPRRQQLRVAAQGVVDELAVRVDHPRFHRRRRPRCAESQDTLDHVGWWPSCVAMVPTGQCSA
ncbi:MAG: hypothetical protein HS111_32130 [Kofleriaceae bacterium]|nr:hypothetical protein [Kofleriaceae bacterium]